MTAAGWTAGINPVIPMDFPDPDIIRVGDTYYLVSTTMYFMPGCVILRSYDLIHWEYLTRVYDVLDSTPAQCLQDGQNAYGKGMWAASLRYHNGTFYITFVANDTHKTYLFRADDIMGPWRKDTFEGFYHDSSLFFDDDGKVYIISGNTQIHLTELNDDLTAPREGGLDRIIADSGTPGILGFEGSHFYKVNGRYYLFVIHSRKDRWMRVESCYACDTLTGKFTGGAIWEDDLAFHGQGVAQGGIVDTPDGRWYCFLFQDRGACGRMPVLLPMRWQDGMPYIDPGESALHVQNRSEKPDHLYQPLYGSDDFTSDACKPYWEWNHTPDPAGFVLGGGSYRITNNTLCSCLTQAVNTLTQRGVYPRCSASVTLDGAAMRDGDIAGLCVLQDCWGLIGLEKEGQNDFVTVRTRTQESPAWGDPIVRLPVSSAKVRIRAEMDFTDLRDEATFFLGQDGAWRQLGGAHKMYFLLSHFTGNRFGLFSFATRQTGGSAIFTDFVYDACKQAE